MALLIFDAYFLSSLIRYCCYGRFSFLATAADTPKSLFKLTVATPLVPFIFWSTVVAKEGLLDWVV